LLAPGASWLFPDHELPSAARSGIVFSLTARNLFALPVAPEPVLADRATADYVCQVLFFSVVGDCHGYRRFKQAFDVGGRWSGIDLGAARGAPLAAEVRQACQQPPPFERETSSAYAGLGADQLGAYDPVFGGHAHHVPLLQSGVAGMSSRVYLHNAGFTCSSVTLWLAPSDRCNRATICTVDQLAPGESATVDVAACVGDGWTGSGWIRSSQPLAVVVATGGEDARTAYMARPESLQYALDGVPAVAPTTVLHAPLAFSEMGGWSSGLQLQNRSGMRSAKVRLDFVDAGGAVVASLGDWLCPRGSRSYFLPLIADLPESWRGAVRVESLPAGGLDAATVPPASIAGVVRSVRYADAARTRVVEAAEHALLAGPDPTGVAPCDGARPGPGCAGLVALPQLRKATYEGAVRSEVAITNLADAPGTTDVAVYLFDDNGLLDFLCLRLPHRQSAYIDLDTYAFLRPGFVGGAVVSAVSWRHGAPVEAEVALGAADASSGAAEPSAGTAPSLAALVLQRTRAAVGESSPNDGAMARLGIAVTQPRSGCAHAPWPRCPNLAP
jgi:hypothetical protein